VQPSVLGDGMISRATPYGGYGAFHGFSGVWEIPIVEVADCRVLDIRKTCP
jgi:hypothetical protein